MLQRYWRIGVLGLALGFALGAALFGILVAAGNPDWRSFLTADEVARSIAVYGLCGVGVSAASALGSWVSIWVVDRGIQKSPGTRVCAAAVGAAAGTLALGIGVSGVTALLEGSASWAAFLVVIAVVLALLSGIAAAALVAVRENRSPTRSGGATLSSSH